MQFEISNEALIIIGMLMLAFLPQIHLFFIFIIFGISEGAEKMLKFIYDYVLTFVLLFYFYSILFTIINNICQLLLA